MSNQIVITSGAKLRDLDDVIIGTDGILSSVAFNVANGVPRLDENGKILVSQLPNSVMEFKGVWNAATNTPTLVNGTGNAGDVWLCNVAGTVNFGAGPIAFAVGDYAVYTGSVWARSSGATGTVTSVGVSRDGNALTITGSPVTTSGTINLGFSGDNTQYINGAGNLTTFPTLITSIGLTMPAAFGVSNSPLTANGTIGVTALGYPSQYIRGDGTLADFPTSGGGGSSVSYYFNGGTSQGTIGGTTYYEMSKTADTGTGVDFNKTGDGFIVAFLTDANDPNLLQIPAGNWDFEIYASMSANGGTPELYAELYKYDGTTFTLIATSSHEILYDGVNLNLYSFATAVPQTSLTVTDRLAIKLYADNSGGKTTTIHTQDSHLCQVITTFSTGLTALNGLTAQVQYFGTGTSGSDFNIVSSVDTHTFNLPTASATKRGALSSADWSTFNGKQDYITAGTTLEYWRGDKTWQTLNTSVVPELTNLYFTDARARTAISLTTTGSTGASTYNNTTGVLNIPNYADQYVGTVTSVGLSAPTGFSVSGSPVTSSGTLALSFASGYSLPTNVKQSNWDDAYTWVAAFPTQTGNTGKFLTTDGSSLSWAANPLGTVTSVDMSVPTGLTVSGNPITTSGTLAVTLTAGYSIPTTANQSTWTTAYNRSLTSAAVTGTTTKTLTLNQQDGGTITASWTDINTDAVTSVFGRTGAVVATSGDYNTDQVTEGTTNLYFTNTRSRAAISLTTTGTSGAATYNSTTGVLNIPSYVGGVTSVFGRTGAVVATDGDYTLTQLGDVTITTPTTGQVLKYNGTAWINDTDANTGTVTSVAMTVPTGLSISGSPITSSGTLAVTFTAGYSIPTNASQATWDTAYTNRITSLTTTGTGGAATLVANVLNIPNYTTDLSGYVTLGTTQTITGQKTISKAVAAYGGTNQSFLIDGASGDGALTINSLSSYAYQTFAQAGVGKFEIGIVGTVGSFYGSLYINKTIQTGETGASIFIKRSNGFVGINNITPTVQLDVTGNAIINGSNSGSYSFQVINNSTTAGTPTMSIKTAAINGYSVIQYISSADILVGHSGWGNGTSNVLADKMFFGSIANKDVVFTSNDVIRVWLKNDGNFGIGTFFASGTPESLLHVSGTSAGAFLPTLTLTNLGGTTSTSVGINFGVDNSTSGASTVSNASIRVTATNASGDADMDFKLYRSSDASFNTYAKLSATSSYTLDITGTGRYSGQLTITAPSVTQPIICNSTNQEQYIYITSSVGREAMTQYHNATAGNWYTGIRASAGIGSTASYHIYSSTYGGDVFALNTSGAGIFVSSVTATSFIKSGGTASQYLMADGSVTTGTSAPTNMVTTDTTQTITGQKTISRVAAAYGLAGNTTQSFLIDGAGGNGALTINSNGGSSQYAYLNFAQNGVTKVEIGTEGAATNNGSLYFNTNVQVGSTGASIWIQKSNGFVGIGQTTASYTLDVGGDIRGGRLRNIGSLVLNSYQTVNPASNVFLYSTPNDRDMWIMLDSADTGSNWGMYYRQIDSALVIGGQQTLPANSVAWVGSGSNTLQAYICLADGTAYVRSTFTAGGDIIAYSDITLKENIRPIENVLSRINNSRGVLYDRIDNKTKNNIGFIAQELEKEFPELVKTNDNGTKSVAYQNAVAVLFEAIKEQQKQINELKNIN